MWVSLVKSWGLGVRVGVWDGGSAVEVGALGVAVGVCG